MYLCGYERHRQTLDARLSYCANLYWPSVTLGGAYDEGGASPVGEQSRGLLQWAVGL